LATIKFSLLFPSLFGGGGGFIHNVLPYRRTGAIFRGVHVGPYRALAKNGSRTYGILIFADLPYCYEGEREQLKETRKESGLSDSDLFSSFLSALRSDSHSLRHAIESDIVVKKPL
jgi:hypothetical protein